MPITLDVANRLVYSAHDYGPDMYSGLAWCRLDRHGRGTGASPAACNTVWDQTWGYIAKNGIAPVLLGEFGTVNGYKPDDPTPQQDYTDVNDSRVAQGYWFSYLTDYIRAGGISWCYWGLNGTQSPAPGRNPSLPDWYGVLDPSWADVASTPLMAKLPTIQ